MRHLIRRQRRRQCRDSAPGWETRGWRSERIYGPLRVYRSRAKRSSNRSRTILRAGAGREVLGARRRSGDCPWRHRVARCEDQHAIAAALGRPVVGAFPIDWHLCTATQSRCNSGTGVAPGMVQDRICAADHARSDRRAPIVSERLPPSFRDGCRLAKPTRRRARERGERRAGHPDRRRGCGRR